MKVKVNASLLPRNGICLWTKMLTDGLQGSINDISWGDKKDKAKGVEYLTRGAPLLASNLKDIKEINKAFKAETGNEINYIGTIENFVEDNRTILEKYGYSD